MEAQHLTCERQGRRRVEDVARRYREKGRIGLCRYHRSRVRRTLLEHVRMVWAHRGKTRPTSGKVAIPVDRHLVIETVQNLVSSVPLEVQRCLRCVRLHGCGENQRWRDNGQRIRRVLSIRYGTSCCTSHGGNYDSNHMLGLANQS